MTRPQALAELVRCAGTQFDPLLVELFRAEIYPQIDASWPATTATNGGVRRVAV
jgi:hypothetical protein